MTAGDGRRGVLRLGLRRGGGTTVLADSYCEAPLHVQRVLGYGPVPHVCMASSSGGILRGDEHRVEIRVGGGAAAHVTTQGATRLYGMEGGSASQEVVVEVGEGAYLELMPDALIPYAGSRFSQRTGITVREGGAAVYSEVVTPGRTGEEFGYDECRLETEARDGAGGLLLLDRSRMAPARGMGRAGVMGGAASVATVYVVAPGWDARAVRDAASAAIAGAGVLGGATVSRGGAGVVARMLGARADALARAAREIAGAARDMAGIPRGEIRGA